MMGAQPASSGDQAPTNRMEQAGAWGLTDLFASRRHGRGPRQRRRSTRGRPLVMGRYVGRSRVADAQMGVTE